MKYLSLFVLATGMSLSTQAKIWRVNNNAGVVANFNSFITAMNSPDVHPGDTLYFEPSATTYSTGGIALTKKLTMIGAGYLLDPANASLPGNAGLQTSVLESRLAGFTIGVDAAGSKLLGLAMTSTLILNGTNNVTLERVYFGNSSLTTSANPSSNITVRKCYFYSSNFSLNNNAGISNLTCENNIFNSCSMLLDNLTGTNIVRNNSISGTTSLTVIKSYFINNIVGVNGQATLTDCTIKNNIFQVAQNLPATASNNVLSVPMADVYEATGSFDAKYKLKSTSPAKAKGLTIGGVINPDCGAFGATDPYVLSGIPNIPTIYTFTAPTSIPSGTPTMNVTFSTRNNN